MKKAPEAFRTISEVSDILDTPAHVLRFWESKFYQIRPVKRAGGRRYYRPDDLALLAGIKLLLQDQGMTIRGVQKVLQEQGVRHVAALTPDPSVEDSFEGESFDNVAGAEGPDTGTDPDQDTIHPLDDRAAVLSAPPPRPEAVRPAPPLPRMPETPEAEPDSAAFPPEPEPAAPAANGDGIGTPAAPDHGDTAGELFSPATEAEKPASGAPAPPPPAPVPPEPEPLTPEPEPPATDQPPPDRPLTDLPGSAPTVKTRPPLPPAPDLSDQPLAPGTGGERPARVLRDLPRSALAADHDKAAMLARRLDALLDRMSDASGAGRW